MSGIRFPNKEATALSPLHLFDFFSDFYFNFVCHFRIISHQLSDAIPSLTQFVSIVTVPAATFLNNSQFYTHVYDLTGFGYSFAKDDIEFS